MRQLYTTIRDLHLYVGLVSCPFVLLFAVSTLALNHRWFSAAAATTPAASVAIRLPDGAGTIEHAREILRQLDVTGEIDYVRHNAKAGRLSIPVSKPGLTTTVEVDLNAGRATVQPGADTGISGALSYLHRKPGPHNVRFRGNWPFMRGWAASADAVVYGILFLTVSGLYLWWMLKAERRFGWALLAAGASTVAVLATAIGTA